MAAATPSGDLDAYLARLGFRRPLVADLATLRALHAAHVRAVPFENASVIFGEPIELDEAAFVRKLGVEGRGGFCYELNGAFAALLREIGFEVAYLEARTYSDGELGRRYEHLALRVSLEEPWLVDVGFGYSFAEPLRIAPGVEQHDPMGAFRLVEQEDGIDVEWRHRDGRWVAHYRFDPVPHPLAAFEAECRFLQSSPDSPFLTGWLCSLINVHGGVTLFGRRLIASDGTDREERDVGDDDLPEVLERWFGVRAVLADGRWVPRDRPEVGEALSRSADR